MNRVWRPASQPFDAASLREAVDRHPIVVAHVWAAWNGYDPPFDESLRPVREEFADRVVFGSVDADDPAHWDLLRRYRLMILPAMACFLHGRWAGMMTGARPSDELRGQVAAWVAEAAQGLSPP